jgi:hypothetical protein
LVTGCPLPLTLGVPVPGGADIDESEDEPNEFEDITQRENGAHGQGHAAR